jgi:hypothetical protein
MFMLNYVVAHFEGKVGVEIGVGDGTGHFYTIEGNNQPYALG